MHDDGIDCSFDLRTFGLACLTAAAIILALLWGASLAWGEPPPESRPTTTWAMAIALTAPVPAPAPIPAPTPARGPCSDLCTCGCAQSLPCICDRGPEFRPSRNDTIRRLDPAPVVYPPAPLRTFAPPVRRASGGGGC